MKQVVAVLLCALLLAGCTVNLPETSVQTPVEQPTEPTQPGLYDEQNRVEQQTDGAVQVYGWEKNNAWWIGFVKDRLLVLSGEEKAVLTMLEGDTLITKAALPTLINYTDANFTVLESGFAYHARSLQQIVYLNTDLLENRILSLPQGITGDPVIASSGIVYYGANDQIRALDPDTQIPRMVKQVNGQNLHVLGTYFNGSLIACTYQTLEGETAYLYVSADSGETVSTDANILAMHTWQDTYFLQRIDGVVTQQIYGTKRTVPVNLTEAAGEVLLPILPQKKLVLQAKSENDVVLSVCNLAAGNIEAKQLIPDITEPRAVCADADCLWFLSTDCLTGKQNIYRWQYASSGVTESDVYLQPLYTAQSPDAAGLERCGELAVEIGSRYHVNIHIWQDAMTIGGGYSLTPEYQVPAIERALAALEETLSKFPEDFMKQTAEGTASGKIEIGIVRSIAGEESSVQYFSTRNGNRYILLTVGSDIQWEFFQCVSYAVIGHVIGNSAQMDYWTQWNPDGFAYGEQAQDLTAFVDAQATTSVTDDRSRTFAYAMAEADAFVTDALQGKLKLLCEAIRKSYNIDKSVKSLPWEQHLAT